MIFVFSVDSSMHVDVDKNNDPEHNRIPHTNWIIGLFLWHINYCRSFDAKSFLYIY